MPLKISNLLKNKQPINPCKHCRVHHHCLPAMLDKKTVKYFDRLSFKSRLLQPGEYLYRQGERSDCLYALRSGILKGSIVRSNGEENIMQFYMPPDIFGFEAMDDECLSLSIVALDQCNVCEIPIHTLQALSRRFPQIYHQFVKMVGKQFHKNNTVLLRKNTEQRVADFILSLSKHYKILGHSHYKCELKMAHQDIANYLSMKPETISRTFRNLQNKQVIKIHRRKVHIKDIEQLKILAA